MKKFWTVNNIDNVTAEIIIYGIISKYDVSAQNFSNELKNLERMYQNIHIRINSGGGDIFEGITIFNLIRNSSANIETFIDGMAASMAAVIALSGKKVHISKYARLMTHRAGGYAEGDADTLRAYADLMEGLESTIASIIAEKTGLTADEAMQQYILSGTDKWITADEALANKLVDTIYDATAIDAPANIVDAAVLWNYYQPVLLNSFNNENINDMKSIATLLGLPENATEADVLAKITEVINAKTTAENAVNAANTAAIESMVDTAIENKQLLVTEKEAWVKNYSGNAAGLKMALGKIPGMVKITNVINTPGAGAAAGDGTDDAEPKTFDELMQKGAQAVGEFKVSNRAVYNSLYKAKYGFEPKENPKK